MSQGLLYHGLGVRGYRWEGEDHTAQEWRIRIAHEPGSLRCAVCGSRPVESFPVEREVIKRGQEPREFRALPLGSKPTMLQLGVQRVECRACQSLRQVAVDFAPPRCHYTHSFARYVLELSQLMTLQDVVRPRGSRRVARHLHVAWDLVKAIPMKYLQKHYAKPRLRDLRRIAIDEIAVAKGRRYQTLVMDLDSGAIVYVGEGRGADALDGFWKRLRRLPCPGRGGGHGLLGALSPGGSHAPAPGHHRLRPFSSHPDLQPEAHPTAPRHAA